MTHNQHSKTQSLNSIITDQHRPFSNLIQHVQQLKNLQNRVAHILDPSLSKHCCVANFKDNTLTLVTHSSSWASRLRFSVPKLLSALQAETELSNLKSIRVIVSPSVIQERNQHHHKLSMSRETSELILNIARTINDPELSDCLKRLGNHYS